MDKTPKKYLVYILGDFEIINHSEAITIKINGSKERVDLSFSSLTAEHVKLEGKNTSDIYDALYEYTCRNTSNIVILNFLEFTTQPLPYDRVQKYFL